MQLIVKKEMSLWCDTRLHQEGCGCFLVNMFDCVAVWDVILDMTLGVFHFPLGWKRRDGIFN